MTLQDYNIDELLTQVLQEIRNWNHTNSLGANYNDILKTHSLSQLDRYNLIKTILDGGYIEPDTGHKYYYWVNLNGERFLADGGFVKKSNLESQKKQLEGEKEKWDLFLAKWQAKTFWPVFIFGIFGGLCGIISLGLDIRQEYLSTPLESKLSTTINTTSILPQTKTGDSKHIPKKNSLGQ